MNEPAIEASLERQPALDRIASLWQELEAGARHSFYLSWHWVGTWLRLSGCRPDLLTAHRDGTLVGLALLCHRKGSLRGLHGPSLHLTTAGGGEHDSPFIEYNGGMFTAGSASEVVAAMIGRLISLERLGSGWCRLHLPGIGPETRKLLDGAGLVVRDEVVRKSPFIDLDAIRRVPGVEFLATRSRGFRSQVRRSLRLFGAEGAIRLEPASSAEDAILALGELKTFHQRRWTARGQPGAFSVPFFERFHRALIASAWPSGNIDMLRLRVGQATAGCLYNFVYAGQAYAYQSGFDFSRGPRHKPGLVSHTLAVQRYLEAGLQRYLLLAGDSSYKRALATGSDALYWSIARRPGLVDFGLDLVQRLVSRGSGKLHEFADFARPQRSPTEPRP